MDISTIKNPPNKYRPIPFWSWNEKLNTAETRRQTGLMKEVGIGGYFMHARGGLQTEYMGEEWFENIAEGIRSGKKLGMTAWAYDENGWPSGFGGGVVNGLGEEYQQKYLRMEPGEKDTPRTVYNGSGIHFYYDVNPFYVDILDKKVVKKFIDEIYKEYYERFGSSLEGVFTDEPEISQNGIPWSNALPDAYSKEYGEDLYPRLIELYQPTGDYKETRKKFWRLITKLFSESYFKQIYDRCEEYGFKFTGHLISETTMRAQVTSNGACMPHYEYFHIPGIDWLGRDITRPLISLQVASAAAQTGKKQILSESFALCGHGVSFSELRRIYEWQMVRGINLLCPHLEGYSLRGIRKRDYPPAMYYQQPWWDEYKVFVESVSRVGMLVAEGKNACDTLLLHPQTSVWILFDAGECVGLKEFQLDYFNVIDSLEKKHIQFHLGDEILMERHGSVKGNKLVIGEMEYSTIVLPEHIDLLDNTKLLLEKFRANGGKVITPDMAEENPVTDNENITYLKRSFDDFDMHYFVNSTKEAQNAHINVDGDKLVIATGCTESFSRDYAFAPMDSLVVLEYKNKPHQVHEPKMLTPLELDGDWNIVTASENAITLDYCDCYFDGECVGSHIPVAAVQEMACRLKRPVDIKIVYEVDVEYVPDNMCMACEIPEVFTFRINGKDVEFCDEGYFRDASFRKTNISAFVNKGTNTIELNCRFAQSAKTYDSMEKAAKYASERNKFTYDMEIESIYITGDFGVRTDGGFAELDKHAVRYTGDFVLDKFPASVKLQNIEQQGFPFFAGKLTVAKKFNIDGTDRSLAFATHGFNGVHISVNGTKVCTEVWSNCEIDLSGYLKAGENTVELTLVNNLRNLLGPHHLEEGESYSVRPSSFLPGKSMWHWRADMMPSWDDNYCFIETSIY
ncbi:MAG: hypothetical protein IJ460_02740 [Clostridia bacterium]|nr:hypothetical protein [Clostridia bacterium]